MFIYVLLGASGLVIITLSILMINYYRQLKQIKKFFSKAEFELVHERQKVQMTEVELSEIKNKFEQQVLSDELTGLPSRQVLEDRLSQILNQSKRFQLKFAVITLSIEQFNMINDVFGYDKCTDLIREVADRLKLCIRQVDVLSRFSNDRFVFIVTQLAKPESIVYVAKRILEAISQPLRMNDSDFFISANMGIAIYPQDGDEIATLLKHADVALSQATVTGHNIYAFYQQDMHDFSQRELMLNSSLLNPDVYQNFILYYRPYLQIESKKIIGIEVAVQWQHPDFGLIDSIELFRLTENSGKILDMGEWLLRNALTQFKHWHNDQVEKISIPISWRQLESSHFIYKLSQVLQELQVDPSCLILEIAEEVLLSKLNQLEKSFNMLKHLKVRIAITHFGVGHLSLQHIQKLSIDYIKIDASLIQATIDNTENETIIKMIIAVANSLKITVISEYVESEAQKLLLQEWGCRMIEGPSMLSQELETAFSLVSH